jgi:SHS2 domain-containing protein
MPYRYLEEEATADVAFEAWGDSLEDVFASAGEALTGVMVRDTQSISPTQSQAVHLASDRLDLLLYKFLEELLYLKDTRQFLATRSTVQVKQADGSWSLTAVVSGEPLDPSRHEQIVDVKAVTMHDLWVRLDGQSWRAHVVLDI